MMLRSDKEFIQLVDKLLDMEGIVTGESSCHGEVDENSCKSSKDKQEETSGPLYMSRKEIMENSPSRKDGIDWKKETYLRKSYCTFLQDLGMRLNLPQVTIATAIIFCHRFFLQQSHARNDRRTIATACIFLAGKVKETPRPLKNVIHISSEIIHKKDPAAVHQIKQEVYKQQEELILLGERVVLATLGFDFDVQLPYKPLIEAIKKFNALKTALARVAWNFVNDGLMTTLCFQFKPHHIAAGALFLASKFLKMKLPSHGEKVWWQELDVTPHQLEEVSNQMLELYEQNRVPPSKGSEVEEGSASAGGGTRTAVKGPAVNEERALKQISSHSIPKHTQKFEVPLKGTENQSNDEGAKIGSDITYHKVDLEIRDSQNSEQLPQKDDKGEVTNISNSRTDRIRKEDAEVGRRDDSASHKSSCSCNVGRNLELQESLLGHSPKESIKTIDKVKTSLGKRREEGGEMAFKKDVMDEEDLIERELEDGVELAVEDEKNKKRRLSCSKPDDVDNDKDHEETRDMNA